MFVKSNPVIAGKQHIELKDFVTVFENPVRQAKDRKQQRDMEKTKYLSQAQSFFKAQEPQYQHPFQNTNSNATAAPVGRNPELDQSINQRTLNDTSAFQRQVIPQTAGSFKTLSELLKEHVYDAIRFFRE